MRQIVMIVIWSLALQMVACGQDKNVNLEKANSEFQSKIPNYEELPKRYKTTKEQWECTQYLKKYGNYILKQIDPFIYSLTDDINGKEIRSEIEGIVIFKNSKAAFVDTKLEFYANNKDIIKTIFIKDINPYKTLVTENSDLSKFEGKLLSNMFIDRNRIDKHITYATTSWTHYASQNKYLTIAFSLESRNKDGIAIKWETDLITFNQMGNIILETKIENQVIDFYLSNDLHFYGFILGGIDSEDSEYNTGSTFQLFNAKDKKLLFFDNPQKYSYSGFSEVSPNILNLYIEKNNNDHYRRQILDIENRKLISLFENNSEFKRFSEEYKDNMVLYLKNTKFKSFKIFENE